MQNILFFLDQVIGSLGEGTFGKVLQCKVLNSKQVGHKEVAIKVIKDQEKYKKAAFIELNTLILMHERDPGLQKFVFRTLITNFFLSF